MPAPSVNSSSKPPNQAPPSNLNSTNITNRTDNNQVTNGLSNRIDLLDSNHGRILCIADLRGAISQINDLAKEYNAIAVIHSGDFGFYEPSSLDRISDRTLRHLIQYSSLITPQFRSQLLAPSMNAHSIRQMLLSPPQPSSSSSPNPSNSNPPPDFALSQFPDLLTGKLKLDVPVYTVWGACEDVAILEKIRAAGPSALKVPSQATKPSDSSKPTPLSVYSISNLTVLDEATTRCLVIGGVRLRLFGLGGAVVPHKLFDNGEGGATIAGGQGTMWTSVLQVGEVIDTAQRVYDPTETRLLISHASPGREGLLAQLALVLKADLTISAGLHFRYGVSYNEFSVQHDQEAFRAKLLHAKSTFNEIWDTVKNQVDAVIDDHQRQLLSNALAVANRVPAPPPPGSSAATEEPAWKNSWNWNLPDAAYGSLVLDIKDGRIGAEMRSQGFNFAYRSQAQPKPPTTPSQPNPRAPITHASNHSGNVVENQSTQSSTRLSNQTSTQPSQSYNTKPTAVASNSEKANNLLSQPQQPESSPNTSATGFHSNSIRSHHQQPSGSPTGQGNGRHSNHYSNHQHRYSKSREEKREESPRTHASSQSVSGALGADSGLKSSSTQPRSKPGQDDQTKHSTSVKVDPSPSGGQSTSPAPSRKSSFVNKKKKTPGGTPGTPKNDSGRATPDKPEAEAEPAGAKNGTESTASAKESSEKTGDTDTTAESSEKLAKGNSKPSESHPATTNGDSNSNNHHNYKGRSGPRGRGGPGQYNARNTRGGRGGGRGTDKDGFNTRPPGPGLVGPALADAGIGNKSANESAHGSGNTGTGESK